MHMDRSGLPAAAGSAAAARSTVAAALAATLLLAGPTAAGTFAEVTGFGSNPGALKMFTYLPDTLRNPAPLVVVMHGCNQNAADYFAQSGWREVADADGFVLILPEQRSVNHPTRCLNFAERLDSIRDLATSTNGMAVVDTNNFGAGLRRAISGRASVPRSRRRAHVRSWCAARS